VTSQDRAARIGIVGSGFRARTMLRVLHALPDRFEVAGMATRNAADRAELAVRGLPAAGLPGRPAPAYATVRELLDGGRPDLVLLTLPAGAAQPVIRDLAAAGVPVPTETPAAGTVEELTALQQLVDDGACVHVAEQYHLEPLVAAQLAIAGSGLLGRVTDAHVAIAHDYHGLSVMRRALGVAFEDAEITARRDVRRVLPSPSRAGDPDDLTRGHVPARLHAGRRVAVPQHVPPGPAARRRAVDRAHRRRHGRSRAAGGAAALFGRRGGAGPVPPARGAARGGVGRTGTDPAAAVGARACLPPRRPSPPSET
jgi:hypothetical protein